MKAYKSIEKLFDYGIMGQPLKTKKHKKLERESNKWAKMMEVPAGGMTA